MSYVFQNDIFLIVALLVLRLQCFDIVVKSLDDVTQLIIPKLNSYLFFLGDHIIKYVEHFHDDIYQDLR